MFPIIYNVLSRYLRLQRRNEINSSVTNQVKITFKLKHMSKMSKQKITTLICRKKLKYFTLTVVIISVVFIFYQLFYMKQLNDDLSTYNNVQAIIIRGTHIKQAAFYTPNKLNQFVCIHSGEVITFLQVNDDYCDCLDGSDEPGTNACENGIFFCRYQSTNRKHKRLIPSSMVNDGVCDCCDGSDEWGSDPLHFRLSDTLQRKLGRYQSPCPNICY